MKPIRRPRSLAEQLRELPPLPAPPPEAAAVTPEAPDPPPVRGWDRKQLRREVESTFRSVGARVWREEKR